MKIDLEQISDILANEVLKRDAIEGDKAKETAQKITKRFARLVRQVEKAKGGGVISGESGSAAEPQA